MATATLEPPTAPTPAPATPSPAPSSPARTGSTMPVGGEPIKLGSPATPAPEPKKGSPEEQMFERLGKKVKGTTPEPEKKLDPTEGTSAEEGDAAGAGEQPADGTIGSKENGSVDPAGKKTKVNPWKLVDEWKSKNATLEKQYSELKTLVPDEKARKLEVERLTKAEARNKELEDEIRYVNYEKSPEFKEKFETPYEKSWVRAMSELKEISFYDQNTGQERLFTANDMLELVNKPLAKAREIANEQFGDYADDIMNQRKEIKNLFEAKQVALEDARKNGSTREAELTQRQQEQQQEVVKFVADTWKQANEAAEADEKVGRWFKPIEGDEDGNTKLTKGFELVDRAFGENPMDPKLTPQQRAEVVRRHAAVRNRAASWGRAITANQKLEAKVTELEKELKQFKASVPSAIGAPASENGESADPMSSMFQRLAAKAK